MYSREVIAPYYLAPEGNNSDDVLCARFLLRFYKQKKLKKFYKRRKKKDSEFKLNQIKKREFLYFNNFIRALNHPSYPIAYFIFKNKIIFVKKVIKIKKNNKIKTINSIKKIQTKMKSNYIELKDSYAKITNGHIANYS